MKNIRKKSENNLSVFQNVWPMKRNTDCHTTGCTFDHCNFVSQVKKNIWDKLLNESYATTIEMVYDFFKNDKNDSFLRVPELC